MKLNRLQRETPCDVNNERHGMQSVLLRTQGIFLKDRCRNTVQEVGYVSQGVQLEQTRLL